MTLEYLLHFSTAGFYFLAKPKTERVEQNTLTELFMYEASAAFDDDTIFVSHLYEMSIQVSNKHCPLWPSRTFSVKKVKKKNGKTGCYLSHDDDIVCLG